MLRPWPNALIRSLLLYLAIVLVLGVVFSLACGSGAEPDASPADPTPAPDVGAIRDVDFRQLPEVQNTLRQLGGAASIDPRAILYADVTGDGREEAAVPIASGGTLGNIAYLVFTQRGGTPALILSRNIDSVSGLVMQVEGGKLIETRGEFGPEDPFCCPSRLRKTAFRWDGARLQVEREEIIANPAGGPKQ